ncbi:hypothetical protein [Emcibacter sp. SYSU 3D8]|uniref:beta strand repeat-containing protein n=1 Tax=Emcibacter sp. SYSU 3D8 TaxID=3133969 RepID=UPI0031FE9BFB
MGQKLASVSIIALATALNVAGTAQADSLYNAIVDWSAETVTIAAGSTSVPINNNQNNNNVDPVATVSGTLVGIPTTGTQDYDGVVAILVDDNSISTLSVLNTAVTYDDVSPTYLDPLHLNPQTWNSIEMWTATGSGATSAATLASLQSSDNGASLKSSITTSEIRISSSDLFAGSTQGLTGNTILAQAIGNEAINTVSGDINPLLSSTEGGFTAISGGPTLGNAANGNAIGASATALVASVQENSLANSSSTIDDTRIGSLAVVIDTTSTIENTGLNVTGNTIEATITGNSAVNQVNLDDALDPGHASALMFNGSAGVASAQRNTIAGRTYLAQVSESDIEAGLSAGTPIGNMSGSTIDFSGNRIAAAGTGNTASNLVRLGDGISQNGTFPTGAISLTRSSTVLIAGSGSDGNTNVIGDLFIGNHQYGQLEINAEVGDLAGDTDDGDMNVLVESLLTSKVEATGNSIGASATGNNVVNTIAVAGATTLDSLVSLGNAQLQTDGSSSSATTNGDIVVSAATLGTITGDIVGSHVSADENSLFADASGNIAANRITLDGSTMTGAAVNPQFNFVQSTHATMESRVAADYGIVSGQFARESEYTSNTIGAIAVEAANVQGAAGSTIEDSTISASDNSISAQSVANRVTLNSFTVSDDGKASSFSGTVGVINLQVAEGSDTIASDHLNMTSSVLDSDDPLGGGLVSVNATARTIDNADISADGNRVAASVIGNLVDAKSNMISITAVAVSDGVPSPTDQLSTPVATVYRSLADAVIPNATPDGLPDTVVQGGFVLVNDQSVENIGFDADPVSFSAYVQGKISVQVGSTDPLSTLTNTDISASFNSITAASAGNQAGNSLGVDAITLDATSTLANTQTFSDEDGGAGSFSGGLDATLTAASIELLASAGATTIANIDAQANDNLLQSSGRINTATNHLMVQANSQNVVDVVTGGDVNLVEMGSVSLAGFTAGNTLMRAETGLLNSQEFGDLNAAGVIGAANNVSVSSTVDNEGGSLAGSVVEADRNTISVLVLGNDAANSLTLSVATFDLSEAGSASAANGPLGVIANHQRANAGVGIGLVASLDFDRIQASVAGVDTQVSGSDVSADSNSIRALGRVNNATNLLDVSGTSYVEAVSATPSVEILDVAANTELAANDLAFGIASYQANGVDVTSGLQLPIVIADAKFVPIIDDTSVSASLNAIVGEARGNDAFNGATLDFGTNHVSGFVASLQQTTDDGANLTSDVYFAYISASAGEQLAQSVTDSHFAADGNAIAAIVSANRATNSATATGTNLYSGTGLTTPSVVIDPAGSSDIIVAADLSVVNVQGAEAIVSDQDDVLTATVFSTSTSVVLDSFDSGSATVDNNLVLTDATIHTAFNTATLDAKANVGAAGDTPSASVVSQQIVTSGSAATALTIGGNTIAATVFDMSDARSASVSLEGNAIVAQATGGSVSNRLNVLADAAIVGGTPAAAPAFTTTTLTLNADFSVLNVQSGETDIRADNQGTYLVTDIGIDALTPVNNDTVTVENNAIQAKAAGFVARNVLVLDAGSSSDATGQAGSRQAIVAGSEIRSSVAAAQLRSYFSAGASGSSISTSNNAVTSVSTGNNALNAVQSGAGASLQESSGAGGAIDPAMGIGVTGSDYAVLNWQSVASTTVTSSVSDTLVGVDGLAGALGVNDSAVTVNGNQVLAQSTGNSAVSSLALNTGTFEHPSASIFNLQTNSETTVSANVSGVTVGIGLGGGTVSGPSSNSTFSVRGNEVGATAIGNNGVNRLTAD